MRLLKTQLPLVIAERIITSSGAIVSSDAITSGLSERTIVVEGGSISSDPSTIVGVSERTITGQGTLDTVTDSIVDATVSRTVSAIEADLTADEIGVVVVAGDGERKVVKKSQQ